MSGRSTRSVRSRAASVHVVIIDGYDECDMYAEALRCYGVEVTTAATAGDGIRVLQSTRPDVIVQGLVFVDLPATELTLRVRAFPHLRDTPIIALSGFTDKKNIDAARAVGADAVLIKPCLPERLLTEIRGLLPPAKRLDLVRPSNRPNAGSRNDAH